MKKEYNVTRLAPNITREAYEHLRARLQKYEAWRDGRTAVNTKDIPPELEVTNDERSRVEVYEFITNPPDKYFCYISEANPGVRATTWTGQSLGSVILGPKYRDNFGGTRQSVHLTAINGYTYFGTYYSSSGNYARVRMSAASKKRLASQANPEAQNQ